MSEDIRQPTPAGPGSPPAPPSLRASDADREKLAGDLRAHAVAGRLDTDELEQRLERAYAARTTGELDALRRDLPATPEQLALDRRERRSSLVRRSVQETGGSLGAFVVCTAIWVASGASGTFWPIWLLVVVALSAARSGWELLGPGADLDAAEARLEARTGHRRSHRDRHSHDSGR